MYQQPNQAMINALRTPQNQFDTGFGTQAVMQAPQAQLAEKMQDGPLAMQAAQSILEEGPLALQLMKKMGGPALFAGVNKLAG